MKRSHSTEDTTAAAAAAGAKRRKVQNGTSVPVKPAAPKRAAATRKAPAKKAAAARKTAAAKKAAPAKKAPVKAPVKKAPAKKTPAKKAPVKKAPAKKAAPAKEAPVKAEPQLPTPAPFLKARTAPVHALAQRATRAGTVFVFGNGDCGQLGLGEDMLERKKPFAVPALADEAVVDVVSGGMHTLALTDAGRLWSWGCNDQKVLGRGGDEFEAAPVEGLDGVRIARVACSDSASFALAEDGHVYAWGTFRSAEGIMGFSPEVLEQDRPMVINAFREPVVDLCAGADHALALSASGRVYAWGCGQQGQLGRVVMERRRLHGLIPERLRLADVAHIGCGSYHSFAVTRSGVVYAWGANTYFQLGLSPAESGGEPMIYEPVRVPALEGKGIVKIAGGEHHSIAMTGDGRLLSFGRSDSHQTGLPYDTLPGDDTGSEHKKAITAPTQIEGLPPVADFACGGNHTLALTSDGRAFAWGYGEMLQLGNGEEEDVPLPAELQGKKIEGKTILKVTAGGQHSAILAA
ncbi:hypothetical protein GGF46_001626 [Coemansia sp. RSA 552]|nr:hypothetical protein GGF46_001626 [Coemansia sp. RSA 552]